MGQTLGLRTFAAAKVRARARSNRGGVLIFVAVLHHKVVASLRLDFTHPTAHKVAATRDRDIDSRIIIPLFRFRVLMAITSHKVAASRIRGKKVS